MPIIRAVALLFDGDDDVLQKLHASPHGIHGACGEDCGKNELNKISKCLVFLWRAVDRQELCSCGKHEAAGEQKMVLRTRDWVMATRLLCRLCNDNAGVTKNTDIESQVKSYIIIAS